MGLDFGAHYVREWAYEFMGFMYATCTLSLYLVQTILLFTVITSLESESPLLCYLPLNKNKKIYISLSVSPHQIKYNVLFCVLFNFFRYFFIPT